MCPDFIVSMNLKIHSVCTHAFTTSVLNSCRDSAVFLSVLLQFLISVFFHLFPFQVFVLLHQLQIFFLGRALPEQPPTCPPSDIPENCRARNAGLDVSGPKLGSELRLGQFSILSLI